MENCGSNIKATEKKRKTVTIKDILVILTEMNIRLKNMSDKVFEEELKDDRCIMKRCLILDEGITPEEVRQVSQNATASLLLHSLGNPKTEMLLNHYCEMIENEYENLFGNPLYDEEEEAEE